MITETPQRPVRRSRTQPEARIQSACVVWLNNEHPETRGLYFCIPNENTQSVYESRRQQLVSGSKRKAMGVVSGVSDTMLLMPRKGYHGLCIEFKAADGRQSDSQEQWQFLVEAQGYKYVVCRSLEQFKEIINKYLGDNLANP